MITEECEKLTLLVALPGWIRVWFGVKPLGVDAMVVA